MPERPFRIASIINVVWEASSIEIDPLTGESNEARAVSVIDPSDAAAFETATRIATGLGGSVAVFSVAPVTAESHLQRCLALGARGVTRVWDDWLAGAAPGIVATALADVLSRDPPDMVLLGNRDRDLGQSPMGPMIAGHLGWPQITSVEAIAVEHGQRVVARRRLGRGYREEITSALPVVACIEPDTARPREASLPALLASVGAAIEVVRPEPTAGFYPRFVATTPPRPRPARPFTPDPAWPVTERLEAIVGQARPSQSHETVAGSPDEVAERIVEFLREREFIGSTVMDG
jgi:electron transfer flavoprotein beta subunit